MKNFWNYHKKSSLITIIVIIICFFAFYLSNIVVRQFNEIYDLKHPFLCILFLNYQSITYFFILILNINNNDNIAINILNINYLIGFILDALCIIFVIIDQLVINQFNVLMGAVPLGLYITLGSVFLLHGLNYLLYLGNRIVTIFLLFSYCLFFCVQFVLTLKCLGFINLFVTPVFFLIWAILFIWLSCKRSASGANIHAPRRQSISSSSN